MEFDEFDDVLQDDELWGQMENLVDKYNHHSKSTQNPNPQAPSGGNASNGRGVVSIAPKQTTPQAKPPSLHPQPQPHRHFMATTPSRTRANREDEHHLVTLFLPEMSGPSAAPSVMANPRGGEGGGGGAAAPSMAPNFSTPRHSRPQVLHGTAPSIRVGCVS
jgi:hypothetical protein